MGLYPVCDPGGEASAGAGSEGISEKTTSESGANLYTADVSKNAVLIYGGFDDDGAVYQTSTNAEISGHTVFNFIPKMYYY